MLPYTLADAAAKTIAVTITVQGCHEVDPKICYPPHPTQLTLDVPARLAATASDADATLDRPFSDQTPALNLASRPQPLTRERRSDEPLPPEQAFVFEAIAASPTSVLARWTMPKGYYLYRDKSSVALAKATASRSARRSGRRASITPTSISARSSCISIRSSCRFRCARENGAAQTIKLNAEYQGCQDNGICYPVMTKTVSVEMPAASAAELTAAKAAFVPAANQAPPSPGLRTRPLPRAIAAERRCLRRRRARAGNRRNRRWRRTCRAIAGSRC